MKPTLKPVLFGLAGLLCIALLSYLVSFSIKAYTGITARNVRMTESYDHTKRTTPLPQNVIDDICLKFALNPDDARCQPGAVAYGPDFFQEIKEYFNGLPKQEAIASIVDEKLGAYLVSCEKVTKTGDYRCGYDLRGDGWYPIFIYFTADGLFDQILAPIGGS